MKVFLRWATDMVVRFSSSLDWVLCLALGMLMLIGLAALATRRRGKDRERAFGLSP